MITNLPNELLIHIFIFSIPPEGAILTCYSGPPMLSCVSSQALVLSRVCSRWRKLAISIPELWSTITVDLPLPKDYTFFEVPQEALALHHQRSQGTPLTITVTRDPPDSRPHWSFYSFLAAHSTRVGALHLDRMGSFLECITAPHPDCPNQSPFPLLETLAFQVYGWPFTRDHRKLIDFFRAASFPSLENLSITYLNVDASLTFTREFPLPYGQLRTLIFRAHDTVEVPHILSSCYSLTTLEVELVTLSQNSLATPSWYGSLIRVSLPNLTEFTVHIYLTEESYTINNHLLSHLHCPSLVSLTLQGANKSSYITSGPLLRRSTIHAELFEHGVMLFLSTSGCTLTQLTIDTISIKSRSLLKLLQTPACSPLRDLCAREGDTRLGWEAESSDFSMDLLRGLFDPPSESHPRLLPFLRNLRVKVATGFNDVPAALESIPYFRRVSLDSVVFEIPDDLAGTHRRDLRKDLAMAIKVVGYPSGDVFAGRVFFCCILNCPN
ncbi:hypothetical protein V5O48_006584 [Marasmius crinis-equi]|uniref:F-box domain-containing protein n=1 Tax=Marasmius crinis-equi TaxID=585013 RepID=A0ABR3FJ61_9AGAR